MSDTPDPRPADVVGPDPVVTDNSIRPGDGPQTDDLGRPISQSPSDDYALGVDD